MSANRDRCENSISRALRVLTGNFTLDALDRSPPHAAPAGPLMLTACAGSGRVRNERKCY